MQLSKKTIFFSFVLVSIILLTACTSGGNEVAPGGVDPDQGKYVPPPTPTITPDTYCNAIEQNPRGDFQACLETNCALLKEEYNLIYSERVDVDTCSTEAVIGTCTTTKLVTHYYDGDPAELQLQCQFVIGTWTTP